MSAEFWWWNRSEISKTHTLSCSPSPSTIKTYPFPLKFCTEFYKLLLYERLSTHFVIVSSFLFLKEWVLSKLTHFYEKYIKLISSKPIKYNKNAGSLLLLLLFTMGHCEKTLFGSAGAQKSWKIAGSGSSLL